MTIQKNKPYENECINLSIVILYNDNSYFLRFRNNITCNQPLQVIPLNRCDYLPNNKAPNAKPSSKAPMIIIAVWILDAASG